MKAGTVRVSNNLRDIMVCSALLVTSWAQAFGQAPTAPAPADFSPSLSGPVRDRPQPTGWPPQGQTPRTVDGKPDLTGAWAPNAIRQNVDLRASLKGEGVAIPFQPWAEKVYLERKANFSKDDPEGHCLPPGVPRMTTTPYPFRIAQTPNLILIVYEGGAHVWRQIFMDGRRLPDHDPDPWWYGYSIGHWEGDTLVVQTTGFKEPGWIDEEGTPISDTAKLTERFRRLNYGTLQIEMTVDDPKTFTRAWSFKLNQALMPDTELIEFVCLENNTCVKHLVGN